MSSNCGETVLERIQISWNQDWIGANSRVVIRANKYIAVRSSVFDLLTDLEVVIAMVQEGGQVLHQVEALQPVVQDAGVLHPL